MSTVFISISCCQLCLNLSESMHSFSPTMLTPIILFKSFLFFTNPYYTECMGEEEILPITQESTLGESFSMKFRNMFRPTYGDTARRNIDKVHTRCLSFLVEWIEQVEKRLPESESIFDGLKLLSPKTVLSQIDRSRFMSLPMLHVCRYISSMEEQYRQILHLDWKNQEVFKQLFIINRGGGEWVKSLIYLMS